VWIAGRADAPPTRTAGPLLEPGRFNHPVRIASLTQHDPAIAQRDGRKRAFLITFPVDATRFISTFIIVDRLSAV